MEFTEQELDQLAQREVSLSTELINGEVQRYVTAAILALNAADSELPITLYIDSTGGNLHAQLSIIDAIRMSKAPIHGVVTGYAGSSAFNILQFCTVRKLYRYADLSFHGVNMGAMSIDDTDWESTLRRSRRLLLRLYALIRRRSGQSLEQMRTWSREKKVFSAQEAVRLGLADEIVPYIKKLPARKHS